MSKRDVPSIKPRDRVAPIVEKVKAINRRIVVTMREVLTVVAKQFDRRRREWVLCTKGGGKFLARFFRKVEEVLIGSRTNRAVVVRRNRRRLNLRPAYAF